MYVSMMRMSSSDDRHYNIDSAPDWRRHKIDQNINAKVSLLAVGIGTAYKNSPYKKACHNLFAPLKGEN